MDLPGRFSSSCFCTNRYHFALPELGPGVNDDSAKDVFESTVARDKWECPNFHYRRVVGQGDIAFDNWITT